MNKTLKDYGLLTENTTYVIAEIGLNHNGDLELAKKLIIAAVKAGADAVKFQTYISEKRAPKGRPDICSILKRYELEFSDFWELKKFSERQGIAFFSTPFDDESVDYLEKINCDMYKIASFDIVNHELLKRVSRTGKPVILSVGMADIKEIHAAVDILKLNTEKITLLHCISAYPTNEADSHLANLRMLEREFDCVIGQSDHTPDILVPLYAAAGGAQVLEKHFRLDNSHDCIDAAVSINAEQLTDLVAKIRQLERIFGKQSFGCRPAETGTSIFRRVT